MTATTRTLKAATGNQLTAQGWQQEAAIRMLHNNLDPSVAEHPEELIVYGGNGKAARNWPSFDALVKTLTNLKNDETMLVQSGKPVGVFQRVGTKSTSSQLQPGWGLGELAGV